MKSISVCTGISAVMIFLACTQHSASASTETRSTDSTQSSAHDSTAVQPSAAAINYDLAHPARTFVLPAPLVEVSGNAWVDKDHLILIEDLHPNLYLISLSGTTATLEKTIPFAEAEKEKTDIEDVAIVGNTVYALWSHGVLFKIDNWQTAPQTTRLETGLDKKNNTEGLCYDPQTKNLLIACKDNPNGANDDEELSGKAIYQFDLSTNKLLPQPFLDIHKKAFKDITGQKLSFNPSAIAVHPTTHDIYILTTRDNKGMAVFSPAGTLKSYTEINKDLMPQPEGICFSPDGKLYISSEGKKGDPGNLFEFNPTK